MPKTALEKLRQKKAAKKVVLDKDFAGIKAGEKMLVGTPRMVADYMHNIAPGDSRSIPELRSELAETHGCDAMCPVSTAIFIRIAAQAAIEEMAAGQAADEAIPFWRVLTPADKITQKLTVDSQWVAHQRELEAGKPG